MKPAVAAIVIVLAICSHVGLAATTDHFGRVTFNGLPVPGATVTAVQREAQLVTVTDQDGVFRLAAPADGVWTIRVELFGFAPVSRDTAIAPDAPTSTWELKLLPLAEMTRGLQPATAAPPVGRVLSDPAAPSGGSNRTRPTNAPPTTAPAPAPTGFSARR